MLRLKYQYPGDPVSDVILLHGQEFLDKQPKDRAIVISGGDRPDERIPLGDEIVCDLCNAEVGKLDPCAWTPRGLYCRKCAEEWILPHVKEIK